MISVLKAIKKTGIIFGLTKFHPISFLTCGPEASSGLLPEGWAASLFTSGTPT